MELATLLLSMPTPAGVQQQTKGLLASLHTNRTAYHNHKVPAHTLTRPLSVCPTSMHSSIRLLNFFHLGKFNCILVLRCFKLF